MPILLLISQCQHTEGTLTVTTVSFGIGQCAKMRCRRRSPAVAEKDARTALSGIVAQHANDGYSVPGHFGSFDLFAQWHQDLLLKRWRVWEDRVGVGVESCCIARKHLVFTWWDTYVVGCIIKPQCTTSQTDWRQNDANRWSYSSAVTV